MHTRKPVLCPSKGDRLQRKRGHYKAKKLYPLGNCEICGARAVDRHHRDGNPENNAPQNIERLCRRCHMVADGRLMDIPPLPCVVCGREVRPLRKGRCHRCNEYWRKKDFEWTPEAVAKWYSFRNDSSLRRRP